MARDAVGFCCSNISRTHHPILFLRPAFFLRKQSHESLYAASNINQLWCHPRLFWLRIRKCAVGADWYTHKHAIIHTNKVWRDEGGVREEQILCFTLEESPLNKPKFNLCTLMAVMWRDWDDRPCPSRAIKLLVLNGKSYLCMYRKGCFQSVWKIYAHRGNGNE